MEKKVLKLDKSKWELTKLGDLAKDISKRVDNPGESEYDRFVSLRNFVSGDIKIKSWGTTENLASSAKAFLAGDILFARRNAYLRRASLVDFDGCCSGDAFVLRENHDKVVPGFLAFFMNSNALWDFANANAAGTMSKRVKWRDLAEYEFLLPPKDQQAQLAKLLWAMDEAIYKTINVESCAVNYRECVLQESILQCYKDQSVKVEGLLVDGPRNGYSPKSNSSGKGIQTVSIGAVKSNVFNPDNFIKYAKVDESVLDKFSVRNQDIFIVRGNGNKNLCGKAGLALRDYSEMFYPDLLVRLRVDNSRIMGSYATYQWNHISAHSALLRKAKSSNGIWKINGQDIKNHLLFVPKMKIQKEIMSRIEEIEARLIKIRNFKKNSKILQKRLINQIF